MHRQIQMMINDAKLNINLIRNPIVTEQRIKPSSNSYSALLSVIVLDERLMR